MVETVLSDFRWCVLCAFNSWFDRRYVSLERMEEIEVAITRAWGNPYAGYWKVVGLQWWFRFS